KQLIALGATPFKARDDFRRPYCKQLAVIRQPAGVVRQHGAFPIEFAALKTLRYSGVGNHLCASLKPRLRRKFRSASLQHTGRQLRFKITEEKERGRRTEFLAHEKKRRRRGEQHHGERGLQGRLWTKTHQPFSKSAVAHLIV